jgi:hypothetical protein
MSLPNQSGFGGKLGRELNAILEELRSQRIVEGDGTLFTRTSMGTAISVKGGGSRSIGNTKPRWGKVLEVAPNHLLVELQDTFENIVVEKPWDLWASSFAAYDLSIFMDYSDGNGFPGYGGGRGNDWFTPDYVMRTTGFKDDITGMDITPWAGAEWADWSGGVQSRFRMVYAPMRDLTVFDPKRSPILEVIWPPYYPANGIGGVGGLIPGAVLGVSDVLVDQVRGGIWTDLNIQARRWKSEAEVTGEQIVYVGNGGTQLQGRTVNVSEQRL